MPTKIKPSEQVQIEYEDIIKIYQQRMTILLDENIKLRAQNQAYAKVLDGESKAPIGYEPPKEDIPDVDLSKTDYTKM